MNNTSPHHHKNALHSFLSYLHYQKHVSKHTIKNYRFDLEHFFNYVQHSSLHTLHSKDADQYVIDLQKQNYSRRTIARKCACLRHFFSFFLIKTSMTKNPFQHIKIKQTSHQIPDMIPESDIHAFLDQLQDHNLQLARQKFCFEMLYGTGIRIAELTHLEMSHFSSHFSSCTLLAKGQKERLIFLSPTIKKWLVHYLSFRKKIHNLDTPFLLVSTKGNPLSDRHIQRELKAYCKQGFLPDWFTPHSFRHAFATSLLNRNIPLNTLKALMGHESIRSTEVYTHVSLDRLKACINHKT